MGNHVLTRFIGDFKLLTLADKEYAIEIIRKQLIDARRDAIAKRAKEARHNLSKGLIKRGTVRDLLNDLESD